MQVSNAPHYNPTLHYITILRNVPLPLLKRSDFLPRSLDIWTGLVYDKLPLMELFARRKPSRSFCPGRWVWDCGFFNAVCADHHEWVCVCVCVCVGGGGVRAHVCVCMQDYWRSLNASVQWAIRAEKCWTLQPVCLPNYSCTRATLTDVLFAVVWGMTAWKSAH